MNRIIAILLIIFSFTIHAQMQDEAINLGGDLKVYSEPNESSKLLFTIKKDEVFSLFKDNIESEKWIHVEKCTDIFSRFKKYDAANYISGYALTANIKLVDKLQLIRTNEIAIKFNTVKADTLATYKDRQTYGLDVPLSMASTVSQMYIRWKGELIPQDENLFNDLFNVYTNKVKFYCLNDIYFIKQKCSDGGGAYQITWVVKDGKVIQRLIDEI